MAAPSLARDGIIALHHLTNISLAGTDRVESWNESLTLPGYVRKTHLGVTSDATFHHPSNDSDGKSGPLWA
jgi:hypothetical protein